MVVVKAPSFKPLLHCEFQYTLTVGAVLPPMSYHFVNMIFIIARIWFAFPTSKCLLRYLNPPLRDLHRFFFCKTNQINELVDSLWRMPHCKALLLAIRQNTVLLFFQPNQSRFCLSEGTQIVFFEHLCHSSLALADLSVYLHKIFSCLFIKIFHCCVLVPLPLVALYQLSSPKRLSTNFRLFFTCPCQYLI